MSRLPPASVTVRGWVLALLLSAAVRPASAQVVSEGPELRLVVRQVAGSTLYLDAGIRQGLAAGDTLSATFGGSDGPPVPLVVTAASDVRSVLRAPDGVRVLAGDSVTLRLRRAPAEPAPTRAAAPARPVPDLADRPAARAPAYGRLALELSGGQTWTRFEASDVDPRVEHTANPAIRLDLTVPEVGAGFRLRTSTRLSYRTSGAGTEATSLRVYAAALEREDPGARVQAHVGRFQSPDESFSGFWDGVHVRYGRSFGVGVLLGAQPDLWNERPSLDRPKVSVVLDGEHRAATWRWSGDVSVHRVWGGGSIATRTFLGVGQRTTWRRLRTGQDLELDRDPETGAWHLSRGSAHASLPLSGLVEVHARYNRRAGFLERSAPPLFADPREQIGAGIQLGGSGARLSADVARTTGLGASTAYTAAYRAPLGASGAIALEGTGALWRGAFGRSWSAAPGLASRIGDARLRAGYRMLRSDFMDRVTVDHGFDLGADVPTGAATRASLRLRAQHGSTVSTLFVDLVVQRSF